MNGFASRVGNHSWIESVQGAVATWSNHGMLITDQVPVLTRSRCELDVLRKAEMNLESMIALAASALLLIYLTYALLRPEKF